jgi:signal transduction histidine kinase
MSCGGGGPASRVPVSRSHRPGPRCGKTGTVRIPDLRESVWWRRLRSLLALVAMGSTVFTLDPRPGWTGLRLVVLLLTAAVGAGWLVWIWQGGRGRATTGSIVISLATGLALGIVHPAGAAVAFPAIACLWAGYRLPPRWSLALTAAAAALFPLTGFMHGFGWWILSGPGGFLIALMAGLIRRQNEEVAQETRLAQEEQARSAAFAEQARIAREIHDVLAHSLAALTVQLETADALLEGGRVDQARESVVRARQLAREGLVETRRAISALRGETLPLPELLNALAAGYRADFKAPATVRVEGSPAELDADTGLALYRSAQEAMTNIRKHAPGAPVRMDLRYGPGDVSLQVTNSAPPPDVARPLARAGGGYGLTGLRERARLAGGTFDAGPAEDGYRVDVRIPV